MEINQEVMVANGGLWNELQKRRNILLRSGYIERTNLTNHFQYTFSDDNIEKEFDDICSLMADLANACISGKENIVKIPSGQMLVAEDMNRYNNKLVELQDVMKINNTSGKIADPTYDEGSYEVGTTDIDNIIVSINNLESSLKAVATPDQADNLITEVYNLKSKISDSLEHANLVEHLRIYQSGIYNKLDELVDMVRPIAINQAKNSGMDSVANIYEAEVGVAKTGMRL